MESNQKKINQEVIKAKNVKRFILAIIIVLFTIAYYFKVTFGDVNNENVAYLVLGYVGGISTTVIGYYFGGNDTKSKEDNKENDLLTKDK